MDALRYPHLIWGPTLSGWFNVPHSAIFNLIPSLAAIDMFASIYVRLECLWTYQILMCHLSHRVYRYVALSHFPRAFTGIFCATIFLMHHLSHLNVYLATFLSLIINLYLRILRIFRLLLFWSFRHLFCDHLRNATQFSPFFRSSENFNYANPKRSKICLDNK